jgi:lipopolysaccharide transport system ATP-binding protein
VTFSVRRGEVLGIVGRNGAGKSTLLKVLSRITEPTMGRVRVRGTMATLLEIGTGFHHELTGRENIFLNGAILGMSRWEIRARFDEIVAFAEIERFLDTPVKRYSSGMYVRLAFAVAAHLQAEILVVDEVLAVGDVQFQKKCLGKMHEVVQTAGRTVLFVSHNMAAVRALCHRALLLDAGRIVLDAGVPTVADAYQREEGVESLTFEALPHHGTGKARFTALRLGPPPAGPQDPATLYTGCDLRVEVDLRCYTGFADANVAAILHTQDGHRIIDVNTALQGAFLSMKPGERATVAFELHDVRLRPGHYYVSLWLGRGGIEEIDRVDHAMRCTFAASPESTKHTEVFPGTYVCRFHHHVRPLGMAPPSSHNDQPF